MQKRQQWLSVATLTTALFLSLNTLAQFGGGPPPDMQGDNRSMPEPPDPEKMVDQEVKWMKKKLKLSPEQTEKVADISTKYAIAQADLMQKIMGKGGRPSEKAMQQVKTQMDQMMKDKDKEMSLVLDPKQFEKYLKRREDATKNLTQNNNNRNGNGGPPSGDFPSGGRGGF